MPKFLVVSSSLGQIADGYRCLKRLTMPDRSKSAQMELLVTKANWDPLNRVIRKTSCCASISKEYTLVYALHSVVIRPEIKEIS
jgi:hypothetical protein